MEAVNAAALVMSLRRFTLETQIYAPGAYISLKPTGQASEIADSGHTFRRLTPISILN